jgi:hypothetical protein
LAEGTNVEVDLNNFGKFSGINRNIIYTPLSKQKPAAFHGKQTVKTLMDMNTEAKMKQGHGDKKAFDSMSGMSGGQGGGLRGLQPSYGQSLIKGLSANDSPTRRYKKPEGEAKISSELLGAGDDPLGKNQEFSTLASKPSQLMKFSFKKPGKAQTRFPPVIDPFSRTLAAPISSQRHYFSVCHKIGSNLTASSKGFYIDVDTRSIKYKDVSDTGTKLNIVSDKDIEPATE